MKKYMEKLILCLAVTGGLIIPQSPPAFAQRTITCESRDFSYRYCRVTVRGGVQLKRRTSSGRCNQGSSWGYDKGGIWVDKGCGGQFVVYDRNQDKYDRGDRYGRNRRNRDKYDRDDWDDDYYGRRRNRRGRYDRDDWNDWNDWDDDYYRRRSRRDRYDRDDYDRNGNRRTYMISCSSTRDRYRLCRAAISRYDRVTLKQRLSNSNCQRGRTWGYNNEGIWVDRGCRALFEVQVRR